MIDKLPQYGLGIPVLNNRVDTSVKVQKTDFYFKNVMQLRKDLAA